MGVYRHLHSPAMCWLLSGHVANAWPRREALSVLLQTTGLGEPQASSAFRSAPLVTDAAAVALCVQCSSRDSTRVAMYRESSRGGTPFWELCWCFVRHCVSHGWSQRSVANEHARIAATLNVVAFATVSRSDNSL